MAIIPFLQAISVSKSYPGPVSRGLQTAALTIGEGKITAIIGESGSGKSTLLKLLYGLLSPDEGEVRFKGVRVWGPEEKLIPGHDEMKMVTQQTDDLNLFAKVRENVSIMLPSTDIKAKEEKTDDILRQLRLDTLAEKQVAGLSGGEKQRLAIARALVSGPAVLLLDEPFNQVDTSFREGLQQDIRRIVKDTGLTVVIVSHDPEEVLSMADELIVIKDGVILESGSPRQVYQSPRFLYTARLLSNCTVLSSTEAAICGIETEGASIVIYPGWAEALPGGGDWNIRQVLFKGNFEDLLVERDGIVIRVLNNQPGRYDEGDEVGLKLNKWLNYAQA